MRSVRTVVRTLIAGFFALVGPVLAAPAVAAHAQGVYGWDGGGKKLSSGTVSASSHQLTVSIDGMTPNFATSGSTVTVHGTITNHTGSALRGVQVQLLTEAQYFYTRAGMDSWAAGTTPGYIFVGQAGTPAVVKGVLRGGATARWTASFAADVVGYPVFGVYPLAAQAEFSDGTASGSARTFLPYWPGPDSVRPLPLKTAWIWPLIDQPQQGPCPGTVATNSLATSLSDRGRLGTLLAVGQFWSARDHLTWAVDPALVSDANVMTRKYLVNANSLCEGGTKERASAAATAWLSSLRSQTAAADPMFVTPYADVDVSALSHAGRTVDLQAAYRLGESVAGGVLSRPFGIDRNSTGDGGSAAVAWPTDGAADASVLRTLAVSGGITTAVLNSGEMGSTAAPADNAVTSASTGAGTSMGVLLADSQLTGILGSASAGSPPSAQFAAEQDFLAETAMIVAELPQERRSLVVAPPRRWDPSATEAAKLLKMTFSAPWLRKVPLSNLAAAASTLKAHHKLPEYQVRRSELGEGYLDKVAGAYSNLAVYEDLLQKPPQSLLTQLDTAAVATESSAWRGAGAGAGSIALGKLSHYLIDAGNVQIITGTKLLLAGASGPAPVSVQNNGQLPVVVKIVVTLPSNSQLTIGNLSDPIVIPGGETKTVKMTVHSTAIGTTVMQLQLVTKDGSPLPGKPKTLSVQTTRYGRALLVLIGAALGVLVLTSVGRWIRRLNDGKADGRSGGTG
jgi:hypothetical protein